MECCHPLVPTVAGLLLVASARVHAGETAATRPLQVTGGDFPALVMVVPGEHASDGRDALPGCDRIRARRLDELPPGWSGRVVQVELDCEQTLADDAQQALTAVTARARLHAEQVQLAGLPVREVRLMDSSRWGDHQYVVDAPYARAALPLRRFLEAACQARALAGEMQAPCTMVDTGDGLYLATGDTSGQWIHPDPEHAGQTLYIETWAD
jgi:hypothetical protein